MVHRRATVLRRIPLAALLILGCSTSPTAAPDAAVTPMDAPVDVAHEAHDAGVDADAPRVPRPSDRCPDGGALPYPEVPEISFETPLPDLTLPTSDAPLRLGRYYTPCATEPRLLVVRLMAAWSGPSQHHAAHTRRLLELPEASRLDVVDVLVSAADNQPPDDRDLADWRARYDAPPTALARSDAPTWRALSIGPQHLPLLLLVDPRTMGYLKFFDAPDTHDLPYEVADALARLDRRARPTRPSTARYDDRLPLDAWEMVQAMAPRARPPADPTNAFADDPRAAALGRALFFDPRLSASGEVACARCHDPAMGLADGNARSTGVALGDRNAPSVLAASGQRWQFWDGRADSAWMQALGPFENPREMGFTRLGVAQAIAQRYATEYTAVYGALPPLGDRARFPAAGMPGQPDWEAMSADDRRAVDRIFTNVGKSIAAFERTVTQGESPFDRYARGEIGALSVAARDGLGIYFESGCAQCHHGPSLSDDSFHNIHFDSGRVDLQPDLGRFEGVDALRGSPFRADGVFSDSPSTGAHLRRLTPVESMRGQFHTPSLRNVSRTGPWGHGGTFNNLRELITHYAEGRDRRGDLRTTGELDPAIGPFHRVESTITSLMALLQSFAAPPVVP